MGPASSCCSCSSCSCSSCCSCCCCSCRSCSCCSCFSKKLTTSAPTPQPSMMKNSSSLTNCNCGTSQFSSSAHPTYLCATPGMSTTVEISATAALLQALSGPPWQGCRRPSRNCNSCTSTGTALSTTPAPVVAQQLVQHQPRTARGIYGLHEEHTCLCIITVMSNTLSMNWIGGTKNSTNCWNCRCTITEAPPTTKPLPALP